jgi:hypothetical protein
MHRKLISILCLTLFTGFGAIAQDFESSNSLAGQLQNHVSILAADSLEGRGLGTEGKLKAKRYVSSFFRQIGLEPYDGSNYYQHFTVRSGIIQAHASNVIGILRGTDPKLRDEFIIIGAHYDHLGYSDSKENRIVFNGADDNASGVAVMMEIARIMSKEEPKRSVVFIAFDAEESGLLGAKEFLNTNKLVIREKIKAMFSLDMVGMYKANKGVDLFGMKTFERGAEIAEKTALNHNISIKRMTSDIAQRTDTQPFGEAGIPAIHAYTGQKSPYHKPTDTWEKLDYDGMADITGFLSDLIYGMSVMDEIIPLRSIDRSERYIGVNVGMISYFGNSRHLFSDDFYNAKRIISFGGGLAFQLHIGNKVTIQAEAAYQSDGSKSEQGVFRRSALYTPANIHWNLSSMGRENRFSVFTGPYHRYNFGGKNGEEKLDFLEVYNEREWGYNVGIGLDFMKWQIKAEWQRSITTLLQGDIPKIKPAAWHFCIAKWF